MKTRIRRIKNFKCIWIGSTNFGADGDFYRLDLHDPVTDKCYCTKSPASFFQRSVIFSGDVECFAHRDNVIGSD